MKEIKLSIVIPSYNEEKNIRKGVLEVVRKYLVKQDYGYEVIIVDDGSKDATVALVKDFIKDENCFRMIENKHGGKAITVMTGMLEASGDIVLFTDMDQATPLREIEKFLPKFEEGFDIVIGSRIGRKGAPVIRQVSAWGFTFLRNIILGLPFKDTQCGFKAFKKSVVAVIFPKLLGHWKNMRDLGGAVNAGFDVETLFVARKNGFKIAEIEVEWNYVDSERVQFVKDAFEAIKDMLRIRLNDLLGRY